MSKWEKIKRGLRLVFLILIMPFIVWPIVIGAILIKGIDKVAEEIIGEDI